MDFLNFVLDVIFAWFYLTVGYLCGKDVMNELTNKYRLSWWPTAALSFVAIFALFSGCFLILHALTLIF